MSPALPYLPRLRALIRANTFWLSQAITLVSTLADADYTDSPAGLRPHRVSGHLRHILDFYDSFLAGLDSGEIDYDARHRDPRTERDRQFAIERMRNIIRRLEAITILQQGKTLFVRMEDADADGDVDPWMPSSVCRELQTLSSHTIHHFALMAVTLQAHGVEVDPDFGMAPSTLRFLQRKEAA